MSTMVGTVDTQTTVDKDRHTRPLDPLLVALGEAECGTCQAILHLLKVHVETTILGWPKGGAR